MTATRGSARSTLSKFLAFRRDHLAKPLMGSPVAFCRNYFGGSPRGGFPKGWFWRCSPVPETGTRVHSDVPQCQNRNEGTCIGKIQTGAHKRGLKPQIFRKNRAKINPGKSGLFEPHWSLFRAYWGLFGADRDRFLCTSQPR